MFILKECGGGGPGSGFVRGDQNTHCCLSGNKKREVCISKLEE